MALVRTIRSANSDLSGSTTRQMMRVRKFLLSSPAPPLWRYCLWAFPLAMLPSLAVFASVYGSLTLVGVNVSSLMPTMEWSGTAAQAFLLVILGPAVETLLLAGIIGLLSRATSRKAVIATLSAVVWGGLHGLAAPLWFFGTVWSFFVFSCAYLAWRSSSFWRGYAAAAIPHALLNLTVLLVAIAT